MASSLAYRRLRAPREDGQRLILPDGRACLDAAVDNAAFLRATDLSVLGRSFRALRNTTRGDVLRLAREYTRQYSSLAACAGDGPLIVSGHQPSLFHAGVWAKNFAIDAIARRTDGQALQVIIDNDLCRAHALRLPTGDRRRPRIVAEPYDQFMPPVPYEQRWVRDAYLLPSFAQRVSAHIEPLTGRQPLVQLMWPSVVSAVTAGRTIGQAFALARHRLERDWGLRTLEVPLSLICETPGFRWFLADLIARGERVRHMHNRRLAEYRQAHRLRGAAQPIPDLRGEQGWTELPFWIWRASDATRRPLWSASNGRGFLLGDRQSEPWPLDDPRENPERAAEQLEAWSKQGLRIRPRALTNTLFARLFLGDLFVHGIGGAKYDQLTDALMQDLYSVRPPRFAVLSMTAWLPIPHPSMRPSELTATRQTLREMKYHPEKFLDHQQRQLPQVSCWVAQKASWLEQQPPRGRRLVRHRGIVESNANLADFLQEKRKTLEKKLTSQRRRLDAVQVLESREWSFCLFPAEFLRGRLLELQSEFG